MCRSPILVLLERTANTTVPAGAVILYYNYVHKMEHHFLSVKSKAQLEYRTVSPYYTEGCRARLPGKGAGQGCRARLPGKGDAMVQYTESMVKLVKKAVIL
jgi:hypothetical protein